MDQEKPKTSPTDRPPRRPYQKPTIQSERIFSTVATGCGKPSGFRCSSSGGGLNS